MLESFEGVGVIFFANGYNPEQIVGLGVRGILLQLFLDCAFGVRNAAFAEQRFRFGKQRRRRFCSLPNCTRLRGGLLCGVRRRAKENHH